MFKAEGPDRMEQLLSFYDAMEDSASGNIRMEHEEKKEKSQLDLELEAYLSRLPKEERKDDEPSQIDVELDAFLKGKKQSEMNQVPMA